MAMNVTAKFQGIIADLLGQKTMQFELPDEATIADLEALVIGKSEDAAAILKQTRPFIDGKQTDRSAPLHDGAEVIFMRPIAGG
jgi:molybdopterin converting factor small subunit